MSHIIKCDGIGCTRIGPDMAVPDAWYTLTHRGDPARHFCSPACLRAHTARPNVTMTWADASAPRYWHILGAVDTGAYGPDEGAL